jgi:5'-nucleotidase
VRALITNDDGIDSPGIRLLAEAAVDAGLDVTVAAPHAERSGSSAALSALEADGRLLLDERELDGLPDVPAFAVHATPALIAFVAADGAFGDPPDVLLSGINNGPNTGQAVLHSGTVGAALTAASHGLPALAVSLATTRATHWDTAALVTKRALSWFVEHADHAYVLNVNVPDIPSAQLRGLRPAELATFGAVQAKVGDRGSGYLTITFAQIDSESDAGTDVAALREGWATATALRAPCVSSTTSLSGLG